MLIGDDIEFFDVGIHLNDVSRMMKMITGSSFTQLLKPHFLFNTDNNSR
jgi:hypothetical protein